MLARMFCFGGIGGGGFKGRWGDWRLEFEGGDLFVCLEGFGREGGRWGGVFCE